MPERKLCASEALVDGGDGVRFRLEWRGREEPAFVVRHDGVVHGYLNRCAHVPSELDWIEGKFFDTEGTALICSIHGATYAPDTGRCLGGPCLSRGLVPVSVEERDGFVYLRDPQAKDNIDE